MKSHRIIAGIVCAVVGAAGANAQSACPPLGESAKTKLADYVRKKYSLPVNAQVYVAESGFVGGTCYRKLQFKSLYRPEDSARPLKIDLIASPDLRFLTRELLDSLVDPAAEEAHKLEALAASLATGHFPATGPKDAPISIVIFSDFECPFCAQAGKGLFTDVLSTEKDKIRLVFRNFPLAMHPWARAAAEAGVCAQRQDEKYFWEFHDYLFANQREINKQNLREKLLERATTMENFKVDEFESCLDHGTAAAAVEQDITLGNQIGIAATPTLFVNGHRLSGYRPEQIRTLIRELTSSTQAAQQP